LYNSVTKEKLSIIRDMLINAGFLSVKGNLSRGKTCILKI